MINTAEDDVRTEGLRVRMSQWGQPADIHKLEKDVLSFAERAKN
jgi:hypothetical protein